MKSDVMLMADGGSMEGRLVSGEARVEGLGAYVCVCVCLCVYSRVGASCVGRPTCVCAVWAPLRRVNTNMARVSRVINYQPSEGDKLPTSEAAVRRVITYQHRTNFPRCRANLPRCWRALGVYTPSKLAAGRPVRCRPLRSADGRTQFSSSRCFR